jgi:glycosyltransferase involved in cell wall biosynthesis
MKVPVVATDVGAVSEIVDDGRTGFVVPPRDGAAIAEAVVRCIEMPGDQARQTIEAARHRIETAFTIDIIAERQKRVYESLVPAGSR